MSIKSELKKLVKETLKSESTNPNWFNGFEIIVTGNIVQIEKNGIKSKQGFLYDRNAKDGQGYNWNLGALGNLVIGWERENNIN